MQSFLFCNTSSEIQNVYIDYRKLFYVLSYDKRREKQNGRENHIPRCTNSETTVLLLVCLLFVKSMTQVLTSALRLELNDCTADRLASSVGLFSRNSFIVNISELRESACSLYPGLSCCNAHEMHQFNILLSRDKIICFRSLA